MVASGGVVGYRSHNPGPQRPKREPFLPWQGWAILVGFAAAMVGVFVLGHGHAERLRVQSEACERAGLVLIQDASGRYVCARYACP